MIIIIEQTKVVIRFTNSFLETLNILLGLQVGDTSRLEHIKNMVLEEKPLYTSDQQYVKNLVATYIKDFEVEKTEKLKKTEVLINCRNCSTGIPDSAKYCTFCGTRQNKRDNNHHETIKLIKKFNPLHRIQKPRSYQTLAIIGALTAIIPILFIVARMDPLLLAINYETGRDISDLGGIFVSLGVITSTLSLIAVIITFTIKNPKKIGRLLFFIAFIILITSIFVGALGFVFILIASKNAYKKRHY